MIHNLVIRKPIQERWRIFLGILSIALLLCGYEWLSYRQHVFNPSDTTIPSFTQMYHGLIKACTPDATGDIWLYEDLWATLSRHLMGMGLGVVLSYILGLLMGIFPTVEAFFLPSLSFMAKVPPTAMLAVFFVLFGTDQTMFIAMIAFGITPILTQTIFQAAKYDVHEELIDKSYTLGASNFEVPLNIITPSILPKILQAIRLSVGPAMVALIAAEYIAASVGLGYRLRIQARLLNMALVYDYVIILGIIGYIMDTMVSWTLKKLCPWFE